MIFTANSAPRNLEGIDSEFRSRMGAGLVTTIQTPDLDTRYRIVKNKAAQCGLDLTEEATSYISGQIKGDVRRIESALLALRANAALIGGRVEMEMVREAVEGVVGVRL